MHVAYCLCPQKPLDRDRLPLPPSLLVCHILVGHTPQNSFPLSLSSFNVPQLIRYFPSSCLETEGDFQKHILKYVRVIGRLAVRWYGTLIPHALCSQISSSLLSEFPGLERNLLTPTTRVQEFLNIFAKMAAQSSLGEDSGEAPRSHVRKNPSRVRC